MFRENRWQILFSSIMTLLPSICTVFYKENDEVELLPLFLPVILLALYWVCLTITYFDLKKHPQNKKVLSLIFWIIPTISVLSSVVTYLSAEQIETNMALYMCLFLGVLFIAIGNYMPKCKQNNMIGIRIKWTLMNEDNWYKTHRFAGFVEVITGIIFIILAFFPTKAILILFAPLILISAGITFLYSYLYYKKQLRRGEVKKEDFYIKNKKASVISAILVVIILVFCAILMFTGKIETKLSDDSFTIEFTYWESTTIYFDDIDSLELREDGVLGTRTYGFGSPMFMVGKFRNSEFDFYTRYTYTKVKECIVIDIDGKHLVINDETPKKTKELYEKIKSRA